jgi:hypothetical protein
MQNNRHVPALNTAGFYALDFKRGLKSTQATHTICRAGISTRYLSLTRPWPVAPPPSESLGRGRCPLRGESRQHRQGLGGRVPQPVPVPQPVLAPGPRLALLYSLDLVWLSSVSPSLARYASLASALPSITSPPTLPRFHSASLGLASHGWRHGGLLRFLPA